MRLNTAFRMKPHGIPMEFNAAMVSAMMLEAEKLLAE